MKVETHNHPTAISPFPGAATGAGGEIRDEGATGRGAKPKAGLTGFSVSNLRIPGYERPWEQEFGAPARIASALEIMLEGPIGAASFNNEFGRPAVCGYFRTFEQRAAGDAPERLRGYHKPIMIAGGLGNVRRAHVDKADVPVGAKLIVRAGPSAESGMSPLELWCNEAQERYLLAIAPQGLARFAAIAERERCPFAVIGEIEASGELTVRDPLFGDQPVDMPLEVLLGKPPRLTREVRSVPVRRRRLDTAHIQLRA